VDELVCIVDEVISIVEVKFMSEELSVIVDEAT